MKRFLYIIIIITAVAIVILLGFLFRYRGLPIPGLGGDGGRGGLPTTPPPAFPGGGNGASPVGGVPLEQPALQPGQKFGQVTANEVADYFIDEEGAITLIQPDGRVARISPQGNTEVLNSTPLAGLVSASFSYNGRKILAMTGRSQESQFHVFDTAERKWERFFADIESPVWAPQALEIVYFSSEGGQSVLMWLWLPNAHRIWPRAKESITFGL